MDGYFDTLYQQGQFFEVVFQPPKRGNDQSAMFHALCNDVARQKDWAGAKRDGESWKRLFCDAWSRETGRRQVEVLPSLDGGNVVLLGIQTRSMSKADMTDLIAWVEAWCADNGVRLTERGYE
jgi:hypothetical protein